MTATVQPTLDGTISRNVRARRIARGWTQEEAGRYFGELTGAPWSNAVWSAAERQTRPRDWTATEIALLSRLFACQIGDLFQPETPIPTCPTCGQEVPR
ncbi:helix-turn-helix transcriptional regulator [Streptomyces sp. ISL-112]|uniref:helix-turn-helix transcriptional regulator n=1 Tax=unclassified Streptomyces TaxID=2593676 RepID=UPI001BE7FADC|nr:MULTISPECIES: helix-turn-helix transcriptional regulator [unclassified Streptomyces]MBT2429399.1 helix-turn-helix transcriptional regulator [Streptomyces sp. ISL-112]MBT2463991.1 helix-turn-helix transcriptional regulator [Streptomyces sp. ISL-63]